MLEFYTPDGVTKFLETPRVSDASQIVEKLSIVQKSVTGKKIIQEVAGPTLGWKFSLVGIPVTEYKYLYDHLKTYNTILQVKYPKKFFGLESLTKVTITDLVPDDAPYKYSSILESTRLVNVTFTMLQL